MYLYSASTSNGLRNFTRFLTNTNSTTYTDADLDASINSYYHQFVNYILEAMDDWDFQGESATTDLVASQQEYIFPSDILKIKRVEVTYDGTNWFKANFFDINERTKPLDSTSVSQDFETTSPYVDLYDNSVFLYPVPTSAVTGGLKIWYEKEATELSSATDEPVIAEAYQKGLCYGASKDYFEKFQEKQGYLNKARGASNNLEKIVNDMKNFYRKKNQDRDYVVLPSYVDYEYGNQ